MDITFRWRGLSLRKPPGFVASVGQGFFLPFVYFELTSWPSVCDTRVAERVIYGVRYANVTVEEVLVGFDGGFGRQVDDHFVT